MQLDFPDALSGEAREDGREETESSSAASGPEHPARTDRLMEEICEPENLKAALRQVKANKGSAGIDSMTVDQLADYLKQHWPAIREQLLSGTYEPTPVRRVEIPKPDGGGVRKLGIPMVTSQCTSIRRVRTDRPDCFGSIYPAGGDAGSAKAVGPDLFQSQLRFSTRSICSSSCGPSAAVHRGGLWLGRRFRFGEIFRSSPARQTDGADCQTR